MQVQISEIRDRIQLRYATQFTMHWTVDVGEFGSSRGIGEWEMPPAQQQRTSVDRRGSELEELIIGERRRGGGRGSKSGEILERR